MTTTTAKPEEKEIENMTSYVDEDTKKFVKQVIENNKDVSTYIIPSKLAREIITEKRLEIIDTIREKEIKSKRDLARKVDRDISAVSKDLDTLSKNGVINYREESNNRKIPELTADKIIIEPL